MASSGAIALIFSVIFITAGNAATSFVEVKCNAENVGQHGQESLLNCSVQTAPGVVDVQIRAVVWKKDGRNEAVLFYYQGELTPTPGYKFADPSWKDTKNISLLITNTVVADEGTYSCAVITDSGEGKKDTSLKVKAKYSKPKMYSTSENADSTLTCESEGGYPQGLIRWFDKDRHDWTESSKMEVTKTDSGLFQLRSKLPLLNGFSKFTCIVFNSSGGKEEETTYMPHKYGERDDEPPEVTTNHKASKIVAPIVVIGSLLVGLLMVLLWRKRSRQARRPSAAPLMGPYEHGAECPREDCRQAEKMMDKECPDSPA